MLEKKQRIRLDKRGVYDLSRRRGIARPTLISRLALIRKGEMKVITADKDND